MSERKIFLGLSKCISLFCGDESGWVERESGSGIEHFYYKSLHVIFRQSIEL